MGLDQDSSKGGGYVGGFFHLFDWKAKSRKKLFSSKSEIPEHSKQGKKNDGNLPMTRLYLMDEDESGLWPSSRGNSCASSVTDEEGYGGRGPSVVARLMGLDSMPTTYTSEPYSTPFFDTQSLREAECSRRRNVDYSQSYNEMYSGDLIMKTEDSFRNHVESKPQRVVNRPIEKFQTEMLPPKSAKTIPITQHKLLSPIKCPGFVPSRNAAHIMEAAAKIIEPGPQANGLNGKIPIQGLSSCTGQLRIRDHTEREEIVQKAPFGMHSSVPLRVRDLKDKVEAEQKTASRLSEASRRQVDSDTTSVRYLRGQPLTKSCNGGAGASSSFRAYADSEEGSSSSKNIGRSISLAVQAKVNVQKRERLSSGERSQSMSHPHEQSENKMSQPFRTQPRLQKTIHKKSPSQTVSSALRQNNQKQNCPIDKDKLPSKSAVSTMHDRKGIQKSLSKPVVGTKTGSRKLEVLDGDREPSQSNTKKFSRKKRSIDGVVQFEKNKVIGDDMSVDRNKRPVQSSPAIQKNICWAEDSRKTGMDVVSFTFTAPLTRSMMGSESPDIGGDALSKLLEQKLRELSYEVGSSSCNVSESLDSISSPTSVFQDSGPTPDTVTSNPRANAKREHNVLFDSSSSNGNHGLIFDPPSRRFKHESQGTEDMEVDTVVDVKQLLDSRYPSPISVLEPSFVTESYFSSDSMDTDWTEGKKHSNFQAAELLGSSPLGRPYPVNSDMELSDSASSLSAGGIVTRKSATFVVSRGCSKPTDWELEYIKEILSDIDLIFRDLCLGRAQSIIGPHLFEQLEARWGLLDTNDVSSRLKRKLLFECVSECMELRLQHFLGGGSRAWELGLVMTRRKEQLAEDVYRDIFSWRALADSKVDDLVDKDMSTQYGRWLDFTPDMFELEHEIESSILSSLIDDAISAIAQL